ncbi:MAG TPA: hypothetical protein VEQ66_12725 [Propionibacteriaceae bacterium]|nr:hypothetical protein [Propionibacteriaceae bacterium]
MRSLRRQQRRPSADRFVLTDCVAEPVSPDAAVALLRIAAEAVILQDEAEAALLRIRRRESLGEIAPRAGPLVRRFFALRDDLPTGLHREEQAQLRDQMAAILHSHAMALSVAMEFLAQEWRSPVLARQLDELTDLGAPARRLDEIHRLLAGASAPPASERKEHGLTAAAE